MNFSTSPSQGFGISPGEVPARTDTGPGADSLVSRRLSETFGMTEYRRV